MTSQVASAASNGFTQYSNRVRLVCLAHRMLIDLRAVNNQSSLVTIAIKNTATILAITEIGDVYLDAYKNIVKSLISDVLPNSLQDAFEITSIIEDNSEIFENYQTLSQIND